MDVGNGELPEFHPQTVLRDWGNGHAFRLSDALTGVSVFGATGSGKTSGPAKHLAYGYLAADFGGLVLCAKKEERRQWEQWAADTGRLGDLVIIDAQGTWRFNFLDWEASRPEEGGGLTINIVSMLDEIAGALAPKGSGGGDGKFWKDSLHHLNSNLVELAALAGLRISLSLLRSIVSSAPLSIEQTQDIHWNETSACAATLREADDKTAHASHEVRADYMECRTYFLQEFPLLSEKTRSIITLTFSLLAHPLITRPLRRLFSSDTNIQPEDAFNGKIIIVDIPVQEFREVGRIANLIWKYCFQIAVLRRMPPTKKDSYLRPVFLYADEAQNFVSDFDAAYQAVARSAGGCTIYLSQNRASYKRVLAEDAVDSLLGNLQCKLFCQNAGETNEWAARLLGERWTPVNSTNVGLSRSDNVVSMAGDGNRSSGVSRSDQRRYFVEPSSFTTLKRGGAANGFQVEAIVYNGGNLFLSPSGEALPYLLLTFNQR